MNILYITSGYPGIYHYFDQCMIKELKKFNVNVRGCAWHDFSKIQSVCESFKPDIIFTMLGDHLEGKTLQWIREQRFLSILWLTEDPYYAERSIQRLPYFDVVFSIDRAAVDYYRKLGYEKVYHLPLGTDPDVFFPRHHRGQKNDICMVGYPYRDRIRLISLILKETPYRVQVVGNGWKKQWFSSIASDANLSIAGRWTSPAKVANDYSGAKIALNTYRPYNEKTNQNGPGIINRSLNNRTFDIAACGTFQLTEYIDDLPRYFKEKEEIISFKTEEEMMEKMRHYLSNDQHRRTVAVRTRNKTLQEHTFHHRMRSLLDIVMQH